MWQLRESPVFLMRTFEKNIRSLLHHNEETLLLFIFPPATRLHYSDPLAAEGMAYTRLCGESVARSPQYRSTSLTPIVWALAIVAARYWKIQHGINLRQIFQFDRGRTNPSEP
jgi:hypothetical protein